jgi:hypothetical protein
MSSEMNETHSKDMYAFRLNTAIPVKYTCNNHVQVPFLLKKCYFMDVADNQEGGVRMGWNPPVNCTLPHPHQQNPRAPSHTA